jgi:beta-lactamase regulating signal transducer with metallopeptidase domain
MNGFASTAIEWAARGLVLSSLLALIVGAIWLAWGRRLPARFAYVLALLPLLPLVLPRFTTWDWQLGAESNWTAVGARAGFVRLDTAPSLADGFVMEEVIEEVPTDLEMLALASRAITESESAQATRTALVDSGVPWAEIALTLWAIGAGTLLFALAASIRRTQRQLANAHALDEASEARLRRMIPRRSAVRFLRSAAIASPAAWGIHDKRIILPNGLEDELDDAQLAWILRHELAHHQRGDLWIGLLQRLVQIVWWFHPLLWWWQSRVELARECACDETAARSLRSDARPAATALLAVASRPSAPQAGALALHSLHRNARIMKTRLTRILQPRTSRLAGFATATLCALLAIGTLLLSQSVFAAPVHSTQSAPPAQEPDEPAPVEEPAPPEEIVEEPIVVEEVAEEVIEEEEPPAPTDEPASGPWIIHSNIVPLRVEDEYHPWFDQAYLDAQVWLLKQQQKDGSWPTGAATNDATGEFTTIGVTAMALLALEVRSPHLSAPRWKQAMTRGVNYLGSTWDGERGVFGDDRSGARALPDHALATYAVQRFRGFGSGWQWGVIYQESVATLLEARNPYGGWRYSFDPDGDNDSMMTSLVIRTLAEAARHGTAIPQDAIEGAQAFLAEMTDPNTGRVGYQKKGSADPRFYDRAEDYPVKYTELCTALSTLARASIGLDPITQEAGLRSLTLIASKPPVWNLSNGSVDYYYWMYGSEAMNLVGGRLADRWHHALREALAKHQDPAGFWPAVDAWSTPGTNVHSTACALLALQHTFRAK